MFVLLVHPDYYRLNQLAQHKKYGYLSRKIQVKTDLICTLEVFQITLDCILMEHEAHFFQHGIAGFVQIQVLRLAEELLVNVRNQAVHQQNDGGQVKGNIPQSFHATNVTDFLLPKVTKVTKLIFPYAQDLSCAGIRDKRKSLSFISPTNLPAGNFYPRPLFGLFWACKIQFPILFPLPLPF